MKPSLLRDFGQSLRARRVRIGLSQEQLAARSRCHRNYIGLLERGERNPSLTRLASIARALECSLPELLDTRGASNGARR